MKATAALHVAKVDGFEVAIATIVFAIRFLKKPTFR